VPLAQLGKPLAEVARDVTEAIKAPRAIFLPWPNGPSFWSSVSSRPPETGIVRSIETIGDCNESGTIHDILIRCADVRRGAKTLTDQGRNLSLDSD
jgi:hypothetical protein